MRLKRRERRGMRGGNLWRGSRSISFLGGRRKRRIGRIRSITIPLRGRFKIIRIKIDQANLSCDIYAQLVKILYYLLRVYFFLTSFSIEYLIVVVGLPSDLLSWHTAGNNLVGMLLLGIRMIFPRKVNLLFFDL